MAGGRRLGRGADVSVRRKSAHGARWGLPVTLTITDLEVSVVASASGFHFCEGVGGSFLRERDGRSERVG